METNVKTNTQAERLKLITMRLKITTRDLSKLIGLNENTLYKINSGMMAISDRTAAKICYFLEQVKGVVVNRQWLLTGEGEMIDGENQGKPFVQTESRTPDMAEEHTEEYKDYKDKYYTLLEEYSRLQAEYNAILKKMLQQ